MNSTAATKKRSTAKTLALFALLLFFSAGLCVGAWWMQHYVSSSMAVRQLLRSEPFHVCAHLGLYGTLYAICRALKLDFAELARRVADAQPLLAELTQEQEKAVVADKKLLLCAICVLSQWTLEQVTTAYRLSEAECIRYLAQLDRIGIIELRPLNRYRLKLAKTFRWRPHGPVMNYFRENALLDYFSGGFDGAGEGVLLVHGSVSRALAPSFLERMQRVAQDFAQQHQADQKLADKDREGYTLLLAMRSWEFEAFAALRR